MTERPLTFARLKPLFPDPLNQFTTWPLEVDELAEIVPYLLMKCLHLALVIEAAVESQSGTPVYLALRDGLIGSLTLLQDHLKIAHHLCETWGEQTDILAARRQRTGQEAPSTPDPEEA